MFYLIYSICEIIIFVVENTILEADSIGDKLQGLLNRSKVSLVDWHEFIAQLGCWTDSYPLGFQPPLKQRVLYNITTIDYFKDFNHRNWVNYYFNGGGTPG